MVSAFVARPGARHGLWIAATVGLLIAAVLAILPAFMAIFLFDAPEVGSNPIRDAVGYALMALPLACFCGAVLPWRFEAHRHAAWLFLLPLVDGAVVSLCLLPGVHLFR